MSSDQRSLGCPGLRLCILLGSDGIGGIERRLSTLGHAFEERGAECDFVALTSSSASRGLLADRPIYVLDPVRSRSPWRSLRRAWRLREAVRERRYHAVLAFGHLSNSLAAVSCAGLGTYVVLSEILSPFTQRRKLWNRTVMRTYALADSVVVHTERLADDIKRLPIPPRTVVIPNPVSPFQVRTEPAVGPRLPRIVAAGRLVRHKRYHDLIVAFASLAAEFPEWDLMIIGDGPERGHLMALAESHGLAQRIHFTGHLREPWQEMKHAKVLAHCAEVEGFGNTLIEGLGAGCAVVSSDCPYGPREILGGDRGLLYTPGHVSELTSSLRRVMADDRFRQEIAQRGHDSLSRFSIDTVRDMWFEELSFGLGRAP